MREAGQAGAGGRYRVVEKFHEDVKCSQQHKMVI